MKIEPLEYRKIDLMTSEFDYVATVKKINEIISYLNETATKPEYEIVHCPDCGYSRTASKEEVCKPHVNELGEWHSPRCPETQANRASQKESEECCKETGAKDCTCICNGVIRATHSNCPCHQEPPKEENNPGYPQYQGEMKIKDCEKCRWEHESFKH